MPQDSLQVINWMVDSARKLSTVSIPGVYMTDFVNFPFGNFFNRGLQIKMGQCPVKQYNEQLLHLIEVGRIDPTQLISHRMKLEEAPKAYDIFDKKGENGEVHKIVFTP
jgi:S-(hydroxymethyl)glutathione dehydrogenase / alcohol dehydrogenase